MKLRSAVPGRFALGLPVLIGMSALVAAGQSGPPNSGVSTTPNNPLVTHAGNNIDYSNYGLPADAPLNSTELARRAQIARAFAEERLKRNAADAARLVALTKSLSESFAAPNPGTAVEDQLRKLKEIEKLAKKVRERTVAPVNLQVRIEQ